MKQWNLEKSYSKRGGETSNSPFSKKSKLGTFSDQQSETLSSFLIVCSSRGLPYILKLRCWLNLFQKTKRDL